MRGRKYSGQERGGEGPRSEKMGDEEHRTDGVPALVHLKFGTRGRISKRETGKDITLLPDTKVFR